MGRDGRVRRRRVGRAGAPSHPGARRRAVITSSGRHANAGGPGGSGRRAGRPSWSTRSTPPRSGPPWSTRTRGRRPSLTDLALPPGVPLDDTRLLGQRAPARGGHRDLLEAAAAAGARRVVVQSIGWLYAPGPEPHDEADPLLPIDGRPTRRAVHELERRRSPIRASRALSCASDGSGDRTPGTRSARSRPSSMSTTPRQPRSSAWSVAPRACITSRRTAARLSERAKRELGWTAAERCRRALDRPGQAATAQVSCTAGRLNGRRARPSAASPAAGRHHPRLCRASGAR